MGETAIVKETSKVKDEILDIISKNPEGLTNKELAAMTGKNPGNISRYTMELQGELKIWQVAKRWVIKQDLKEKQEELEIY